MADDFAEFHAELRSVAGDVLAKDRTADWSTLVNAGWTGLEVPDALGGAGASFAETAVILEEIGRAAGDTSFLGGAVLAVGVLNTLPQSSLRDELLTTVASGPGRLAVVDGQMRLDGTLLTGIAEFVPDAAGADRLLVLAGDTVAVVDAADVDVTPQPLVDQTRSLAAVRAEGVTARALPGAAAASTFARRAEIAVACDSLGIASRMLAATVDYVTMRHQFGRPVGSFQAVKHACADMLVAVEVARQLVGDAVAVLTAGGDAVVPAAMAKSYACSAAVEVAGKAMQLHGGIGYTWESGVHIYLKRATVNRSLFGSTAALRQRIAHRYSKGT